MKFSSSPPTPKESLTNIERLRLAESCIEILEQESRSQKEIIDYLLKELDVVKTLILIFGENRSGEFKDKNGS